MKESYPVDTAEYAFNHDLQDLPGYKWWVYHVRKKRDRIISAISHCKVKKNYKYGHQVPTSVREAYEIDCKSNSTLWREAIAKEMKNVRIAF